MMADEVEYEDDFEDDDEDEPEVFASGSNNASAFSPTEILFEDVQLGDQLGGGGESHACSGN
jgi:hypothetical protein